jgi:hypothetical protein
MSACTPTRTKAGRKRYSVRSGRREVAIRDAWSPREALIEYLITLGCRNDEMMSVRADAISWRGAVFTAAPTV